jgi:membrane-anchored glycerophosphoryl diester phosphodiesterase (GDPDase)
MKVLLMLGYSLWERIHREAKQNRTQQQTKTYIVCWLYPIIKCKTLVFLNSNIYTYYNPLGSVPASLYAVPLDWFSFSFI